MKNKIDNKQRAIRIFFYSALVITILLIIALLRELNQQANFYRAILVQNNSPFELYQKFLPLRRWEVREPVLTADGALVALINNENSKILLEKNSTLSLPIASLTKLMTALIAIDQYSLDDEIIISEEAFLKDIRRPHNLYPGERYRVKDLLYANLMESSNTAAQALGEKNALFLTKMNQRAQKLGMRRTRFTNFTGLDPLDLRATVNRSSPEDLLFLTKELMKYPLIWEILITAKYDLRTADGVLKHRLKNTNELIGEIDFLKGGKTGRTARAGENFLAVFKRGDYYLLTIVLGSKNRFEDTRALLNWIEAAHFWKTI